jgi:hypothetical protein
VDKDQASAILSRNRGPLCSALAGRVCLHSVWKPHPAMDDAPLPTISFDQRKAQPWILCLALRQHRNPIYFRQILAALSNSGRFPLQTAQCHLGCHRYSRRGHRQGAASVTSLCHVVSGITTADSNEEARIWE